MRLLGHYGKGHLSNRLREPITAERLKKMPQTCPVCCWNWLALLPRQPADKQWQNGLSCGGQQASFMCGRDETWHNDAFGALGSGTTGTSCMVAVIVWETHQTLQVSY